MSLYFARDGVVPVPQVIADDTVAKLRLAAATLRTTGRPFFLASGLRKPHMPWRFPAPYLSHYPPPESIAVALHPTMDPSMPPIAHHSPDLGIQAGGTPWQPMNTSLAQLDRLYYYASVSWVDSRIGLVLGELDALELTQSTLVVMHADHGWALGEHGQWQKFNNWEVGVRVPLLIRAPWLGAAAASQRSSALVELVDIFPTMVELSGLELPTGDDLPLDGISLAPVLRARAAAGGADGGGAGVEGGGAGVEGGGDGAEAAATRDAALSVFGRCPRTDDNLAWLTNTSELWRNNWCEFVDRSAIPWMGFSMRTRDWRYTEWVRWDGAHRRCPSACNCSIRRPPLPFSFPLLPSHTQVRWDGARLRPDWTTSAGVELYDHRGDDGSDFDATENVNVAAQNPTVVAELAEKLHGLVPFH